MSGAPGFGLLQDGDDLIFAESTLLTTPPLALAGHPKWKKSLFPMGYFFGGRSAPYIENGTVLFPRTGCEQLLGQISQFGRGDRHDDLCDGLTTLLNGLVEQGLELPKIHWIRPRVFEPQFSSDRKRQIGGL